MELTLPLATSIHNDTGSQAPSPPSIEPPPLMIAAREPSVCRSSRAKDRTTCPAAERISNRAGRQPKADEPLSTTGKHSPPLPQRMNEHPLLTIAIPKRTGGIPPYFHIAQRRYSHSSYYASGKQRCCAPAGATEMRLDWQGYHLGTGLAHDHRRLRIW